MSKYLSGIAGSLPSLSQSTSAVSSKLGQTVNQSKYVPDFLKGTVKSAANTAAKQTAEKAAAKAVNESAAKIPGAANAVKALGTFGISKTQMVNTTQQLSAAAPSILQRIGMWFQDPINRNVIMIGFAVIFVTIVIGLTVYFTNKSSSNFQNIQEKAGLQAANAQVVGDSLGREVEGIRATVTSTQPPPPSRKKEGFQNRPGPPPSSDVQDDLRLVNLQPLTIKQAGFVGPIRSGVFSERDAVQQSLRAGFRSFIFQIDYHEDDTKKPPSFPGKGEPCLLYRNDAGVLTSINAGSIKKTAEAIADLAFQPTLAAKNDPVLIVLHGLRAPDSVSQPREYLAYCSKIASQLKALAPYHLGLTSEGDYHRQALAGQLFTSNFSKLEKKVVILSTFDTSLFRSVEKLGMKPYSPVDDLDYWVNAQIFKEDEKANLGVATVNPTNTPLRASVVDLGKLLQMSVEEQKTWAVKNRDTFTVGLPSQTANPPKAQCEVALKTLGLNVLPLDIFSSPIEQTRDLMKVWEKKAWNLRPLALRATARKGKT